MFEHTFIAIGFMSLIVTALATAPVFDKESKLVWSLMGMILWGVWALQAPSVEVLNGGVSVTESYRSLLVVGALFAALMALSAVMRVVELFKE